MEGEIKVFDEENMADKAKKETLEGKEREEDECQRVILELACFPGGRKTPGRSKPQSDKGSQPTNEPTNKRMKKLIFLFYIIGAVSTSQVMSSSSTVISLSSQVAACSVVFGGDAL